ncbi:MAG: branched-chain amino acid ABC transporter substrate-binding protein [Betaproteobacteria bacterium]|nr:branched-chain amino acid ABC transporter substrate-binding protein [Betaproteobacteria bacterium]
MNSKRRGITQAIAAVAIGAGVAGASPAALAQKQYGPGVTDKEIKIGNIMPYSGPASAYGAIGKAAAGYYQMINDQGGVNGRKINFVSLDALVTTLGTPTNSAIHKYMNQRKVPHLFIATGATKWGDPKGYPWTMGFQPSYQPEAKIYVQHILETKPNAKIAILYQNDDYGKDYLKGFEDGLGDKAKSMIVAKVSYEVTDPTIDSQMVQLKASGADTFFNITIPKFAAMAIKKAAEIGWKPTHYLNSVSNSAGAVMVPAGAENGIGIITGLYWKEPDDPEFANDKAILEYLAFMKKYLPQADTKDLNYLYGYSNAMTVVEVLKKSGDNLTRENVMKQAAALKDFTVPTLLPGINVSTAPDDFFPIERMQTARWDGKRWVRFGKVLGR